MLRTGCIGCATWLSALPVYMGLEKHVSKRSPPCRQAISLLSSHLSPHNLDPFSASCASFFPLFALLPTFWLTRLCMLQRVSVGHELLINPSVLLLDEPTSVRHFLQSRTHLLHLLVPRGLNSGNGITIKLPTFSPLALPR